MRSGMTIGKFMAFMVAALMELGSAVCFAYDAWPMFWMLCVCGSVLGVWVISDASWDRHNDEIMYRTDLVRERTKFAMTLSGLDAKALDFLAIEWPELGLEFGIEPRIYILENGMNTKIYLPCFQKFLEDSSEQEFADVRKYNDDKYLQQTFGLARDVVRKQWQLATQLLLRKEYLMHGSMAGSHSYQWKSKGHYRKLARQYAIAPNIASLTTEQRTESEA